VGIVDSLITGIWGGIADLQAAGIEMLVE